MSTPEYTADEIEQVPPAYRELMRLRLQGLSIKECSLRLRRPRSSLRHSEFFVTRVILRKPSITTDRLEKLAADRGKIAEALLAGRSVASISQEFGISTSALYRRIARMGGVAAVGAYEAPEESPLAQRCACGLLLPCDPESCPATAGAVAYARNGRGGNLADEIHGEGGGGDGSGKWRHR